MELFNTLTTLLALIIAALAAISWITLSKKLRRDICLLREQVSLAHTLLAKQDACNQNLYQEIEDLQHRISETQAHNESLRTQILELEEKLKKLHARLEEEAIKKLLEAPFPKPPSPMTAYPISIDSALLNLETILPSSERKDPTDDPDFKILRKLMRDKREEHFPKQ